MNNFDLLNPKWEEAARLQIKSGDGNKLHVLDFRQFHRLTKYDVENLDQLLKDYHKALAAATNALYRVAQWAVKPVEDEGNFDKLVMILPGVARALDMVGIEIDETAVKDL